MLLSDRDIRAEITAGRVAVEPFEESMIQPSSVDVRLDKFFRVFENHKYLKLVRFMWAKSWTRPFFSA